MVAAEPTLSGSQVPRICVVPEGGDHPRWSEVVDFVTELGIVLDPWQMMVLRASLRRRGSFWAAFAVACCAPRQNGKNAILEVRELIGPCLLGEPLLIHTAHLADTSKEAFRRLDDLLDANAWLSAQVKHIWRTNGHESIEFKNGRRIRFRTRTRGGGRGFSGSPVFFDEAMFLPLVSMGAILPVVSAQEDPQVWYMGSAVDQSIMDDGLTFARVRDRALKGEDDRLAYFEWSLDAETPDQVTEEQAADAKSWADTNPALGIRITADYLRAERDELDPRTFAVERLGVGDWPDPAGTVTVIDMAQWTSLEDAQSEMPDPVCLAFDVSPDRKWAAIAAAGKREDELMHVEVVDHRPGTGWVVPRLKELCDRHYPSAVVCDSVSPAASLLNELDDAGVEVEKLTASQHAQACGMMFDLAEQGRLRHLGQPELEAALRGAATRPLGEAWAWKRKQSTADICPLVAATLAVFPAMTAATAGELLVGAF